MFCIRFLLIKGSGSSGFLDPLMIKLLLASNAATVTPISSNLSLYYAMSVSRHSIKIPQFD